MTKEQAQISISNELKGSSGFTPKQIHNKTGIQLLLIYRVLKNGLTDGTYMCNEGVNEKRYQLFEIKKEEAHIDSNVVKKNDQPIIKRRDTSKYTFNGVPYSKGQCVLNLIKEFITNNRITYEKLKDTFPDSLVQRFGVVNTLPQAEKLTSSNQVRYFLKEEQQLCSSDLVKFVVTNQWTSERFEAFMIEAKKIGYSIQKAKQ